MADLDDAGKYLEFAAEEVREARQAKAMGSRAWAGFVMAARRHAQQAHDELGDVVPEPEPLLNVIFRELRARGWTIKDGGYVDPEGNLYPTLEDAVRGQSVREIAGA